MGKERGAPGRRLTFTWETGTIRGMTPRTRLLAQLAGDPIDRVPVWTQVPFAVGPEGMYPGPFHGYADYDLWREADPLYRDLVARMERDCDNPFIWRPACMQNLQFVADLHTIEELPPEPVGTRFRFVTRVALGDRTLEEVREVQPGTGHSWQIKHLCDTPEDAAAILEREWNGAPVEAADFALLDEQLGDRGIMWVTIPSPIMVVCRLFDPTEFLIVARTHATLINELLALISKRIQRNLERLFETGVGPVIRFGGAEHATPPLMSPDDFDKLVVGYDLPLVESCKRHGRYVAYHCHGNLRHALARFREMGVDQIDPTEAAPDGDITAEEARRIAGDAMTLVGNIQCRELFADDLSTDVIRDRVHAFLDAVGSKRTTVTTTGTPLEPITSVTRKKYDTLIDAALGWG